MIELKTIESDKYEPVGDRGHVRHVGMITVQDAFDRLSEHLTKVGLMPDEYFTAPFGINMSAELPDFDYAVCHTNWGGSEGIYIDISLTYYENREKKSFPFATGKTLESNGDAFLKMSRIAAECSMMLNGRGSIVRLSEHAYDLPGKETTLNDRINAAVDLASSSSAEHELKNPVLDL